ncbi:DUF7019 family protein [Amycolatopsis sp.]|uniref:DUF7019 family protein n=1 Tax=Amycolatopsis sp. TaxID=37632 RepID=UPI002BB78AAA|nr:SAVMC3_10250 family protein [Amycolatopsis sp.]HVV10539.1 SAVMC3_10250 family protein [Amycolatopsis sp.]
MSFRYYLYISDSKLDMLLPQIDPGFDGKRRSELGLKLPVLSFKETADHAVHDRTARLERVVRHLHDHGDLGSVEEPGQFFWGMLPMQWGRFPDAESLVFAGGRSGDTVVGLGGSGRHLLDTPPGAEQPRQAWSNLPPMLEGLASDLEDEIVVDAAAGNPLDLADATAAATVSRAVDRLTGPAQNLEFVAKRLLHGDFRDERVLLGSPVYIALVD